MTFLARVALIAIAIAGLSHGASASDRPVGHAETKDRLSPERMEALVARPMSILRSRGLAQGQREFERLLAQERKRHGFNSVRAADLITSFGIELYLEGHDQEDKAISEASLKYLKSAIAADKRSFGALHPEVAVALQSYVDAELNIHEDNPASDVEPALREAYRIRLKVLGPKHPETLAVLKEQAAFEGHPSRVKQDPAHLTRSAELFEQLIARSPNRSSARDMSAPRIRFLLARMYARNGLGEKAIVEARRALDEMQSWPADDRCVESNIALIALAQELRDHDQASAAGELPANDGVLGLLSCMSAPEERSDSRALQG